jgi:hypothetical protein
VALLAIAVTVLLISGAGAQPVIVSRGVDLMESQPTYLGSLSGIGGGAAGGLLGWTANYARRRLTIRAIADVLLAGEDAFQGGGGT